MVAQPEENTDGNGKGQCDKGTGLYSLYPIGCCCQACVTLGVDVFRRARGMVMLFSPFFVSMEK